MNNDKSKDLKKTETPKSVNSAQKQEIPSKDKPMVSGNMTTAPFEEKQDSKKNEYQHLEKKQIKK